MVSPRDCGRIAGCFGRWVGCVGYCGLGCFLYCSLYCCLCYYLHYCLLSVLLLSVLLLSVLLPELLSVLLSVLLPWFVYVLLCIRIASRIAIRACMPIVRVYLSGDVSFQDGDGEEEDLICKPKQRNASASESGHSHRMTSQLRRASRGLAGRIYMQQQANQPLPGEFGNH